MMKLLKVGVLLHLVCVTFLVKAEIPADTTAYWTISYDKAEIIHGSLTNVSAPRYEVSLKEGSVKDVTITFVYPGKQPQVSSLAVKEKNELLRTLSHDPDMGPYFVVPLRELIGTHQTGVRYELDFYYTDDRGQKNLKLGTIVFIFK